MEVRTHRALESKSLTGFDRIVELTGAFVELIKFRITFFVGMSAAFGYILASNDFSFSFIAPVAGIFLLSCGSAVLNHYQERESDSLMHRTNRRPLPAGTVAPLAALSIVLVLAISGSLLVYLTGNVAALVLALMAFVWYNAIYTPLKKMTAFAVIPGSLVGSLPVAAGWAAAGGSLTDPQLIAVATFFFIWQIPHFWLLMDLYGQDYERGGFPVLSKYFDGRVFSLLTYGWIVVLAFSSAAFVLTGVVRSLSVTLIVAALGAWLIAGTFKMTRGYADKHLDKIAFLKINVYVLAVTLVVMMDKVLSAYNFGGLL